MRFSVICALAGVLLFSAAHAAPAHDMAHHAATPQVYHALGVIKQATPQSLSIAHGTIADLNWPPMTMTFLRPADAELPEVQPGDKVSFDFIQGAAGYQIVSLTPQR